MAEYIKREDAVSHPFANVRYDKKNANLDFILGYESYKEWLENLPAADVRENVRGEWIHTIDDVYDFYKCSVCGQEIEAPNGVPTESFCPHCGSAMVTSKKG